MRVATYNLRYDAQPDDVTVQQSLDELADPLVEPNYLEKTGEWPWSTRRIKVAQALLSEGTILVGFQEALARQVDDLAELLGDEWSWVGVGRDDGRAAGEFNPIYYKTSEIVLLSHDTFWLSNSPFKPSKYPNAGSYRIATVGRFELIHSTQSGHSTAFTLINTHLDDQSDDARRLGASLVLTRARYEAANTEGSILIMGDFNSSTGGTDSGAYDIITGAISPAPIDITFSSKYAVRDDQLPDFRMLDLLGQVPRFKSPGNFATYTGFGGPSDTSSWVRIDFIFGGSNGGWAVDAYKGGTSLTDDGILASDHRPVYADISI